ncbi:MAG: tetratricopeptide repeat protein [Myxococcales bacterium]|nr:tetratricopeptide repeat protein [Myxococcales bacterium]
MTQMDGDRHAINWDTDDPIEQAQLYAYGEQYELAEEEYREVLAEDANNAEAYFGLARLYFAILDLPRAEQTLQEGLRAVPESAPLHSARALLSLARGEADAAREWLAKAEALDPEHYHVSYARGRLLMDESRYSEAAEQFRLAADRAPAVVAPFSFVQLGAALVEQAKEQWSPEVGEAAVNAFLRAVEIHPQWELGYCFAVNYLRPHPDPEVPLSIAERGLVEFPSSKAISLVALSPLIRAGRLEDAEFVVTELLPDLQHDVAGLIGVAEIIAEFPDLYPYALELLEFGDTNNPNNPAITRALALIHAEMGNDEKAAHYRARAQELS